jgi:hypothetical protein
MKSRVGRRIVVVVLGLLLTLVEARSVLAEEKSLLWHRWDSDIQINADGTFTVHEVYEVEFVTGSFTFGYRSIPLHQFTSIKDVMVSEEGVRYRQSRDEADNTFYVEENSNEYLIGWFYPETAGASRIFVVEYTVVGGLLVDENSGDRLFWKAVGPEHAFPISSSMVVVHMPPGAVVDSAVAPAFYGVDASYSIDASLRSVIFGAVDLPANQEFEVDVRFPHGFVAGERPAWQADYEKEQQWDGIWRPRLNLLFGGIGTLLFFGGVVGVVLRYMLAGRDPKVVAVPSYVTEPPSDLPPGLVGTLVDEKADLQDIIATVVDLARRGVIEMEEREKAIFGLVSSKEFVFHKKGDLSDGVRPYEKLLVDKMFGSLGEIALNDLRGEF